MTTRYRTVDLAGVAVALAAESRGSRSYLDWHFGTLVDAPDDFDLVIELVEESIRRPESEPTMLDGPILRWELPSALHLWHESGAGAVITDQRFTIGAWPPEEDGWRITRQLLFSGLSWLLDRRGALLLHAAMVGQGGEAALVFGPTGAGKSTVVASAMSTGWEVLSDDLVVIRPHPHRPMAFGVPKRMAVDAGIARQLGVPLSRMPSDPRGRVMLSDEGVVVGWRGVRALIEVRHHDGEGEAVRMTHDEALTCVMSSFLEAGRSESLRRHLGLFGYLADRPAWSLAHASDAARRLSRASEFLQLIWSRS